MELVTCKECKRSVSIGFSEASRQKFLKDQTCSWCRGKNLFKKFKGRPDSQNLDTVKNEPLLVNATRKDDPEKKVDELADDNLEKTLADLDKLVGMARVKESVHNLIGFLEIMREREKHNIKNEPTTLHIVFRGPPGTGKTTVARILGRVYRHLGYLKSGHMEETDRSGLVGEYVGHTAVKTHKIVDKALDGVLFIDEAYSLSPPGSSNDFGSEAIAALVKRMEDNRSQLAVFIAGYTNDMARFLDSNAGLKSRFNTFFDFDTYSAEELVKIFEGLCKSRSYSMAGDTLVDIVKLFETLYNERDERTFGNGRLVRNIMEMAIRKHAARVHKIKGRTKHILMEFLPEDLPTMDEINMGQSKPKESEPF